MKTQIKHRYTGAVLFECAVPKFVEGRKHIKYAVGKAIKKSANLSYADLRSADLRSADLSSANLRGNSKITGARPVFTVGPIGSRSDTLTAFNTGTGLILQTGCFFGSLDEFRAALIAAHDMNKHREEYEAALTFIEKHFTLWGTE